uniref:Uncharacterized protein n=1 Tax=Chromera velia CCMP2878 TaxID=1169474 RepID=A0A0G4IA94_9ALVE|eukprot:Cvel_2086.t1-p1 / transcript=Cvel_2086.t1 / gene=Cvel_2086 / organism=Chromera_velia_CCMP2878 / gene_product=hypothetical protein / transcript_product=hypothetical protein / location=Cvel_scaffold80:116108-117244(+) / protein_length=250 / sequence_SO=supercontig / SO=protein_coding / is_pseudo=false
MGNSDHGRQGSAGGGSGKRDGGGSSNRGRSPGSNSSAPSSRYNDKELEGKDRLPTQAVVNPRGPNRNPVLDRYGVRHRDRSGSDAFIGMMAGPGETPITPGGRGGGRGRGRGGRTLSPGRFNNENFEKKNSDSGQAQRGGSVPPVSSQTVGPGGQDDDNDIVVTGGVSRRKRDSFNLTIHASKGEEMITHGEGSLGKVHFADCLGLPLCYEPGAKYSPDYDTTTFHVWHDGAMERLSAWDPVGTHTGVDV